MLKRIVMAVSASLALLLPMLALTGNAGASQWEATYEITFENVTEGQWLTPPNYAAHRANVRLFKVGKPASAGVQAVAENGAVPVLADEIATAVDAANRGVSGVGGAGPIAPGDSVTFTITTDERKFSLVSMIICTNDGFAGADKLNLPKKDGQTSTFNVSGYDAGTELNTENRADLVPAPFCGPGGGTGASNPALAENGVVRPHPTLLGVGDQDASFDWDGPVARLSITKVG